MAVAQVEESSAAATINEALLAETPRPAVGQSLLRGALALLSTQPATWAVSLISATAVPRLIGADALGQVAFAVTIVTLATTVTSFGITDYLVRRIAQQPATLRRDLGLALTVQMAAACLAAVLIAIVGPRVLGDRIDARLLWAALLPLLGAPAQTVLLSSFRGREQHLSYAWFSAAGFVLYTVGGLVVLLVGGNIVQSTATCGILSIAVTAVAWKLSGVRPIFPRLNRPLLLDATRLLRRGAPFLCWALTLAAYGSIDRVLLGLFVSSAEVGWYAAAYRIVAIPVFIPNLITAPLFPALSRSHDQPETLRQTIAHTLRLVLLLNIALTAIIIVASPMIPSMLGWPPEFSGAVPLMAILSLHLPIVAVDMVLGVVIMAVRREAKWVFVGIAATVFNVVANGVGIPFFQRVFDNGAISASIVTVCTETLMFVGAVILIPKSLLDACLIWKAGRLMMAGACGALLGNAVLFILLAQAVVPAVAVGASVAVVAMIYVGVAVLLRALTLDDADTVLRLMSTRRQRQTQVAA